MQMRRLWRGERRKTDDFRVHDDIQIWCIDEDNRNTEIQRRRSRNTEIQRRRYRNIEIQRRRYRNTEIQRRRYRNTETKIQKCRDTETNMQKYNRDTETKNRLLQTKVA